MHRGAEQRKHTRGLALPKGHGQAVAYRGDARMIRDNVDACSGGAWMKSDSTLIAGTSFCFRGVDTVVRGITHNTDVRIIGGMPVWSGQSTHTVVNSTGCISRVSSGQLGQPAPTFRSRVSTRAVFKELFLSALVSRHCMSTSDGDGGRSAVLRCQTLCGRVRLGAASQS